MVNKSHFKIDFVGMAVNKAATTWIYRCLKEHPEICMSKQKETHIFLGNWERKREVLRKNFDYCSEESIKGEYTPSYLVDSKAPQRIKKYNSDMKLIACLRDPVQRAWSQYLHDKNLKDKNWKNLKEATQEDRERIVERGLYYKHLKKWYSEFPDNQVLIVFFEDLRKNPKSFIRELFKFLEVDSAFVPNQVDKKISPTSFKNSFIGRLFHKTVAKPLGNFKVGKEIKQNSMLRNWFYFFAENYSKLAKEKKPTLSDRNAELLYDFYKQDIKKLEEFINKDLDHWKYERRR